MLSRKEAFSVCIIMFLCGLAIGTTITQQIIDDAWKADLVKRKMAYYDIDAQTGEIVFVFNKEKQ